MHAGKENLTIIEIQWNFKRLKYLGFQTSNKVSGRQPFCRQSEPAQFHCNSRFQFPLLTEHCHLFFGRKSATAWLFNDILSSFDEPLRIYCFEWPWFDDLASGWNEFGLQISIWWNPWGTTWFFCFRGCSGRSKVLLFFALGFRSLHWWPCHWKWLNVAQSFLAEILKWGVESI